MPVTWELGEELVAVGQSFGIMLFTTATSTRSSSAAPTGTSLGCGRLGRSTPTPRELRPGASWRGTVGADGALAAGRYVRVVFGPLVAEGDAPEGMPGQFYWITDHAHRLHD